MAHDWRREIVRLARIKEEIQASDKSGLWEYRLPGVAATPDELAEVEEHLQCRLEPQYREFLSFADGWPSFFQNVDLFGTGDLVSGPRMQIARQSLAAIEPAVVEQAGLDASTLLPIAATAVDLDLFVTQVVDGEQRGPVVWLAGAEIDRFATFEDFVLAMIEYNARELEVVKSQLHPGSP